MCGIAGLWAPDIAPEERQALVERMLSRLSHRGPDGTALWSGGGITLGLTRLAIVAPHQPACVLTNETGTVHAVVNGEVYNHRELARGLTERGHRLAAGPDTAVIVHLYEERGPAYPRDLDGMFAAALWDEAAGKLVLARDRAGEKPLFLNETAGRLAFASEPAALVVLPWISREPSAAALVRYLTHGFFAGGDCAFAALRQLPPGSVIEAGRGGERASRYWRPWDALATAPAPERDSGALVRRTHAGLEQAVVSRIPDEVPFGVFLSGGVDSALVTALAARARGRFPTFSLRILGPGYDESAFARLVADHLATEHHESVMDERLGEEVLAALVENMDQPLGDPSVLPTWALAREASRHVPVVLTGEGGDELFAGYPTYLGHRHAALAERVPAWLARAVLSVARRARPADRHISVAHLLERFLSTRGSSPFERHLAWFGTATPHEAQAFLAPALRAGLDGREPLAHVARLRDEFRAVGIGESGGAAPLVAYQLLDFELYLGGGLLSKIDRCAMSHGVETRAPFLRRELIELAFSLPESAKLRGSCGKWVLKRIASALLPAEIPARRKQGFSPPFSAWARGPLSAYVLAKLSPQRVARAGVLDPPAVGAIVEQHLSGAAERGRTLWTLLSLQLWADRWLVDAPAGAAVPVSEHAAV